jgi:hypothetical protein
MRSMIFAALVAATTISVASAESVSTPSPPPVTTDNVRDKPLGISSQQEIAIPYIPCIKAVGWVNGRLRCDNRY